MSTLSNSLEIIKVLTVNKLKVKYKRSFLGFSWSLLNPILNITVIAFVFSNIMHMDFRHFAIFFFSGFLPWTFFAGSITQASNSLIINESLIKKVPIKKFIFPAVAICVNLVEFVLGLVVLGVILIFVGLKISWVILFLPIVFLLLLAFITGLSLILAVVTSYFQDVAYILTVVMQLWFYLTPVLYPKHFLEHKAKIVLYLNPMAHYVVLFRDVIANAKFPAMFDIYYAIVASVVSLTLGLWIYKRCEKQIVFRL